MHLKPFVSLECFGCLENGESHAGILKGEREMLGVYDLGLRVEGSTHPFSKVNVRCWLEVEAGRVVLLSAVEVSYPVIQGLGLRV